MYLLSNKLDHANKTSFLRILVNTFETRLKTFDADLTVQKVVKKRGGQFTLDSTRITGQNKKRGTETLYYLFINNLK